MQKTVVITGASSGIGLRTAQLFSERGFKVYNLSRTPAATPGIIDKSVDVTDAAKLERTLLDIAKTEGGIHTAVYCAGYSIAGAVEDTPLRDAKKLFDVNFFGAAAFCKTLSPIMKTAGGGHIILTGSLAGILALPFETYYSCSKAAINMLARSLRRELLPFGVQVSCLQPGGTATPFSRHRQIIDAKSKDYAKNLDAAVRSITEIEQSGAVADKVAKKIVKICEKETSMSVYTVGIPNGAVSLAVKLLPYDAVSFLTGKLFKQQEGKKTVTKRTDSAKTVTAPTVAKIKPAQETQETKTKKTAATAKKAPTSVVQVAAHAETPARAKTAPTTRVKTVKTAALPQTVDTAWTDGYDAQVDFDIPSGRNEFSHLESPAVNSADNDKMFS